jgi:hypothetical protein
MDQEAFTLRFPPEQAETFRRLCRLQPAKNINAAMLIIVDRLDTTIRKTLDPETLKLYDAGELDCAAWRRAAIAHQQRKAAKAEEQAAAS